MRNHPFAFNLPILSLVTFIAVIKNVCLRHKHLVLLAIGIVMGFAVLLAGKAGVDATSSDKFCEACHVHPEATQTWIKSKHFTTKSGVVKHCIDCPLPAGGIDFYSEKARLGAQDIYGKLFKDTAKINWHSKQTLDQARTFTYDDACIRCHANLFSVGLSRKGVDGHLLAAPQIRRFEYSLPRMGTVFRIEMYAVSSAQASEAAEAAFARAEELEQIMSDYRADSELMRLSREGGSAPFPVSSELYEVLAKSQWTSELSGGVFDISIGPLVDLWRGARKTGRLPDATAIARARSLVDYRNIELDPARHTVYLKRPGMKLDLGAIGKGYAADQMLAVLQSRGIKHAMVVAGGEVVAGEPPPGSTGWKVAVDTADAEAGRPACTLLLHAAAASTSGDEHQFLEVNCHRYSHVINPRTGWALEGQRSTTVIALDSTTADALATAFSLMPQADAIRAAESQPGVSAMWVRREDGAWRRFVSRGFPASCRATTAH
jgi:thiamine biosynthesis lipoprotein